MFSTFKETVHTQTQRWLSQDRESLYNFITNIFYFSQEAERKGLYFHDKYRTVCFLFKFYYPQITGLVISIQRESSLKKLHVYSIQHCSRIKPKKSFNYQYDFTLTRMKNS